MNIENGGAEGKKFLSGVRGEGGGGGGRAHYAGVGVSCPAIITQKV